MIRRKNNRINRINHNGRSAVSNFIDWSIPIGTLAVTVLLISYITFVSLTTIKSASRRDAELKISSVSEKISSLENELAKIETNITPKLAESMGFLETKKIQYISNKPIKAAFRVNEI
jgi:hypothetical protein